MPNKPVRNAGWKSGISRGAALYVQNEFGDAVRFLATELRVTKSLLTERALLAYMEAQPNGSGARALQMVASAREHTESCDHGYRPQGGGADWAALVKMWGPAPYSPRSGFKWVSEGGLPTAQREASKGTAYHCLWCDAYTVSGDMLLGHVKDCPTIPG